MTERTADELVPITVLAKKLYVSTPTVRLWIRHGVIPKDKYMVVGNTYRFDAEGIIQYMLDDTNTEDAEVEVATEVEAETTEPMEGDQNVG